MSKIILELEEQGFKLVEQLGFAIFSGETEFVLDHLSSMDAKQLIALILLIVPIWHFLVDIT